MTSGRTSRACKFVTQKCGVHGMRQRAWGIDTTSHFSYPKGKTLVVSSSRDVSPGGGARGLAPWTVPDSPAP